MRCRCASHAITLLETMSALALLSVFLVVASPMFGHLISAIARSNDLDNQEVQRVRIAQRLRRDVEAACSLIVVDTHCLRLEQHGRQIRYSISDGRLSRTVYPVGAADPVRNEWQITPLGLEFWTLAGQTEKGEVCVRFTSRLNLGHGRFEERSFVYELFAGVHQ